MCVCVWWGVRMCVRAHMPTHDKGRDKRKISFPIYLYKAIVLPRLSFLHGGKSGHGGDELLWRREVRTEPQGWAVRVWLVCFPVSLNTLSLLPHEDYIQLPNCSKVLTTGVKIKRQEEDKDSSSYISYMLFIQFL